MIRRFYLCQALAMIIVSATSAPVFWQVHEKLFKFSLLSDTTDRSMILLAERNDDHGPSSLSLSPLYKFPEWIIQDVNLSYIELVSIVTSISSS